MPEAICWLQTCNVAGSKALVGDTCTPSLVVISTTINSLHPRVRKRNFPCNDDNVAFMQQVHSKTTGKRSVLLIFNYIVQLNYSKMVDTYFYNAASCQYNEVSGAETRTVSLFPRICGSWFESAQLEHERGQSFVSICFLVQKRQGSPSV